MHTTHLGNKKGSIQSDTLSPSPPSQRKYQVWLDIRYFVSKHLLLGRLELSSKTPIKSQTYWEITIDRKQG